MSRQGIQTATNRMIKTSYKGLSIPEKRYIKLKEEYEQAERSLYGYGGFLGQRAKRLPNNSIDWKQFSDRQLDVIEHLQKRMEQIPQQQDNLIDKYNLNTEQVESKHLQYNTHSVSFGGSSGQSQSKPIKMAREIKVKRHYRKGSNVIAHERTISSKMASSGSKMGGRK